MRFEDLKAYGGIVVANQYKWLAPMPGSNGQRFMTHDYGVIDGVDADKADWRVLPDDWWEYAAGLMDYAIVKAPRHYRPEQDELSQEEIDSQLVGVGVGQRATLEDRLRVVLCRRF